MADEQVKVGDLRQLVARFVAEREWQPYHDPKNLAMSIAIEAGELMESFQWVRSEELAALTADPQRRAEIADELADVVCYALALANALGLDVSDALRAKMVKNEAKYPVERFRGRYHRPAGA